MKFTVKNILTWGLEIDKKYGGYKLPVSFKYEDDVVNTIDTESRNRKAKNSFYGDSKTLYFKIYEITDKQERELLNKGKNYVDIDFNLEDGVYTTKKGVKHLVFDVVKLKKVKNFFNNTPSDS